MFGSFARLRLPDVENIEKFLDQFEANDRILRLRSKGAMSSFRLKGGRVDWSDNGTKC